MLEIILGSFSQLFHAIEIFLESKDLTLGAILAGVSPFIVLWIKISNEKGKKAKQMLIERRQLQIAFNVNEILEALKVESKWSIQEIESTHTDLRNSKRLRSLLRVVTILRRKKTMERLKSRKLWITVVSAALLVIKEGFDIQVDSETVLAFAGIVITAILGLAHVDAKKVESGVIDVKPTINGSSDK